MIHLTAAIRSFFEMLLWDIGRSVAVLIGGGLLAAVGLFLGAMGVRKLARKLTNNR